MFSTYNADSKQMHTSYDYQEHTEKGIYPDNRVVKTTTTADNGTTANVTNYTYDALGRCTF